MQQGMLFHTLYAPETEAYIEQLSCTLHGNLNTDAFRRAWQEVLNRHDILRSAFIWQDVEEPLQIVHDQLDLPFEVLDWSGKNDVEKAYSQFLAETRRTGLDLSDAPLLRIYLIRVAANKYHFVFLHHHVLIDGWGLPVIMGEVFKLYNAYDKGEDIYLETPRPYSEYIAWLQQQDMEQAKSFWQERMAGFTAPTPLTVDKPAQKGDTGYRIDRFNLDEQTSQKLHELARTKGITLNTVIQGAWAFLLSRYSRNDDVVFGATVSGRPAEIPGIETMVGLFINTLPVRAVIDDSNSFSAFLNSLQMQQAETRQYEYTPLIEIQGVSDVPRDLPLFETLLVFENYPMDEAMQQQESELRVSEVHFQERSNYPLTLVSAPGKIIAFEMAYETARLTPDTIGRMAAHFKMILTQLAEKPETKLKNVQLLDEDEYNKTVYEWNETDSAYPDKTIHSCFEEMAKKYPQNTALVFGEESWNYNTLNRRANQIAHLLIEKGLRPEEPVAICLPRSFDMIAASIAVLKAGGCYVPIDSTYPADRISYIIEDSKAGKIITHSSLDALPADKPLLHLDKMQAELQKISDDNLSRHVDQDHLAYIIYTSGSTGKPKGVMLRHGGFMNLADAQQKSFEVTPQSHYLQFASFSFDAAVGEIFVALTAGAALYLIEKETILSKERLTRFLNENEIHVATLPPSLLSILADQEFPHLQTIASVGEACSLELAAKWKDRVRFFNGYGPTEASVGCAWTIVDDLPENTRTMPIGKPIQNDRLYILDEHLKPCPIGVPGELCIASVGLARGYLRRPGLSAEKFVPDPFGKKEGARLYRTGDLVRWLPDGNLEFLGRIDFQVKIRGNRIELGEIEAVLTRHENVREAVVLALGDNPDAMRLAAYVVLNDSAKTDTPALRRYMAGELPEYMLPSAIVLMDAFPLTHNGKINRRALPEPQDDDSRSGSYVAPATPTEELLAGIWADVLKKERVGAADNFFELGGHSLLATQLVSRIRDAFNVELPLRDLFEQPTVAYLAQVIDSRRDGDTADVPPLKPQPREGDIPLTYSQQRLWFLDQLQPGGSFYNIGSAFIIKGALQEKALQRAVNALVLRHEILRTTFEDKEGKPVQRIAESLEIPIQKQDFSGLEKAEQVQKLREAARKEFGSSFDLAKGPLLRVHLITLEQERHALLTNIHHIIADGWSMGVIISEIAALYAGYVEGEKVSLPPLDIQYADYAIWQRDWLKDDVLEDQLNWWKNTIGTDPPVLELPLDHPRPAVQTFNGASFTRDLSNELSQNIERLSNSYGVTPFMTYLAAFQALLHRYSNQPDIIVGSPIANRRHSETEKLVGFFVNNLVLKTRFEEDPEFGDLLKRVRENTLAAYAHQDVPFEQIVDAVVRKREMSHSPVFQVMFVFQNLPQQKIESAGLTLEGLEEDSTTAKFDISLTLARTDHGMAMQLEYNTDLFERHTMERMASHYMRFLDQAVKDPELTVSEIKYLGKEERELVLDEWNHTAAEFDRELCVHEKFARLVAETPDQPALIYKDKTMSYAELDKKAGAIARKLQDLGVAHDDRVGICLERSFEMMAGIVGTLKAGAAFVPLDPAYPRERLNFMIEDSGLKVLLYHNASKEAVEAIDLTQAQPLNLDEATNFPATSPRPLKVFPHNLAYMIYTSGSTGRPKGTLLPHRGLLNLANEQRKAFQICKDTRILQFSSLSFDAATWETVMALLNGATLCLVDREILNSGETLVQAIKELKITTVTLPPSVLAVFPKEELPDLKTIVTAGEKCTTELVRNWAGGRRFFNAYGPTETTVCASMYLTSESEKEAPPIGSPIGNFRLYVLDEHQRPVAIGIPGELCIGGEGLARGYHKRAGLTAEKFIPDPFSGEEGSRLYRSGDLVRWTRDGNLEFMGRIDQQVKVRGFRIELGEIESTLGSIDGIRDAVVLAREDVPGEKRLVGYYVTDKDKTLQPSEIRSVLKKTLPEYMVPAAFVALEAMPLTPNGKIDRRALPAPEMDRSQLSAEFIAPRNETEKALAEIAGELLHLEKVGVYDNFFELGGHSLLATQYISRVRSRFDVEIPLMALFEKPTIAELADAVEIAKASGIKAKPKIERVDRSSRAARRPGRRN